MKLKNYQEDIVLQAIRTFLEGRNPQLLDNEMAVNDIAAYVLNRISPRYILSERGFTRFALDHLQLDSNQNSSTETITLIILIERAIELFQKRRPSAEYHSRHVLDVEEQIKNTHNFPQIVGQVIDQQTHNPVIGATVILYLDNRLAPPMSAAWLNPFTTASYTKGYFSFWPSWIRSSDSNSEHHAQIEIAHTDYKRYTRKFTIESSCGYEIMDVIETDRIHTLDPIELIKK